MTSFFKKKKIKDKKHLRFVAEHPCWITGQEAIAHHIMRTGEHGMGTKSGDNWAIPLSPRLHHELHNSKDGEEAFYEKHGKSLKEAKQHARMLYELTLRGK